MLFGSRANLNHSIQSGLLSRSCQPVLPSSVRLRQSTQPMLMLHKLMLEQQPTLLEAEARVEARAEAWAEARARLEAGAGAKEREGAAVVVGVGRWL